MFNRKNKKIEDLEGLELEAEYKRVCEETKRLRESFDNESREIIENDFVMHRCRLCYMVVTKVESDNIYCEWMDRNYHMQERVFKRCHLIKIDEESLTRL